ncbi:GNAT family N-acetyltransferase [Paractinoplanes rishiriensis]|uniref:GNAT family N-acetyltransferase n=1 Tax=Paractinoplanes rishiriensis TaxID=1050105 RepID=UPI003F68C476
MRGWRRHGPDAELKRMYTAPTTRGQGLGRRMLATIEESARAAGCTRLPLSPPPARVGGAAGMLTISVSDLGVGRRRARAASGILGWLTGGFGGVKVKDQGRRLDLACEGD